MISGEGEPSENERSPIALVGAGEFGSTLVAQAIRSPHFRVAAICDQRMEKAVSALRSAAYVEADYARCGSRTEALAAIERNLIAIVEDYTLLDELPVKAVVEATGSPITAADIAERAIRAGFHVAMATKEAEVVVGPALSARARSAGVVHTIVDGDQPSLLIGLVHRAQMLGLPIIAGGKSTESDYVFDAANHTISAWGRTTSVHDYDWELDGVDPGTAMSRRRIEALPTKTVPDLCEMAIVANHTDLAPDIPDLHGPVARTIELPSLFRLKAEGGLLRRKGVVDVFTCLRRADELSFAGGVFVVVEAPDSATGRILASKGIPTSTDGRYVLLHNPVHLLGIEALASLFSAVRFGRSTGGREVRQRYDLVGRTARSFSVGEPLVLGERHEISGLIPQILPSETDGPATVIPYYLAAGGRIARPIAEGQLLAFADVEIDQSTALYRLRGEQRAPGTLKVAGVA